MSQIRLTRTEEIDNVLSYLQRKYPLLSDAEIIKMVLSEKYHEKVAETVEGKQQLTRQFTANVIDLETSPSFKYAQARVRTSRRKSRLLSMAGVFKGAKDLSSNKKKYSY